LVSGSYIRVSAISNCGTSLQKLFKITKLVSATPGVISGPTNPCIYIGTGDSATYTIRKIEGAASYNWIMPTGATAYHPAGLGENDTIVKVTFNSSLTTTNTIGVQSVGCNISMTRTLTIVRAIASIPTILSGPTNACTQFNNASDLLSNEVTYRTKKVANATGYTWTIPANVDSVSTLTNRDTFIVVRFKNAFTSGVITVKAVSPCGSSAVKSLAISKLTAAQPGVIQKTFVPSIAAITNAIIASICFFSFPSNWDFCKTAKTRAKTRIRRKTLP
jgi:hypothetical protein